MKNNIIRKEIYEILSNIKQRKITANINNKILDFENLCDYDDLIVLIESTEKKFDIQLYLDTNIEECTISQFIDICQEKINNKIMERYIDSVNKTSLIEHV